MVEDAFGTRKADGDRLISLGAMPATPFLTGSGPPGIVDVV
jgi:hypothetical protein